MTETKTEGPILRHRAIFHRSSVTHPGKRSTSSWVSSCRLWVEHRAETGTPWLAWFCNPPTLLSWIPCYIASVGAYMTSVDQSQSLFNEYLIFIIKGYVGDNFASFLEDILINCLSINLLVMSFTVDYQEGDMLKLWELKAVSQDGVDLKFSESVAWKLLQNMKDWKEIGALLVCVRFCPCVFNSVHACPLVSGINQLTNRDVV